MRVAPLKAGHSNRIECGNNPVNWVDPAGLCEDSPTTTVDAAIASGDIAYTRGIIETAAMSSKAGMYSELLATYEAAEGILVEELSTPACFDCVATAETLSAELTGVGITNEVVTIQADANYMFWRGEKFAETGFHQAVRVGNTIYDKLTGPAGMQIEAYMAELAQGSINPAIVP